MSARSALPALLESFFRHRLTKQRNASLSTIASYRDALRMLILFAAERTQRKPCALAVVDLDRDLVLAFLNELEQTLSTAATNWFSRNFRAVGLVLDWRIRETHGFTSMVLDLVRSTLLSFVPRSLKVTRVVPGPDRVTIEATPHPAQSECPTCSIPSRHTHSTYRRVLHDLPWQGRPVTIEVTARRLRCLNRECKRLTFAEDLSDVAGRFVRRTGRLRDLQRHLGLALGGEAGARLAVRIAVPTSPDTLLRLASARRSAGIVPPPRVLGIDDWAELAKVPTAQPVESQRRGGDAAAATARCL